MQTLREGAGILFYESKVDEDAYIAYECKRMISIHEIRTWTCRLQ